MIEALLQNIGLSDHEAKLYIALLRHGEQTITFLSKKVGINRGLGYVLLHTLLEKGLVTKTTKGKVLYFAPLDPRQLVSYLENKKKDIVEKQERVQAMLGQLAAITNPLTTKPKIRFVDGTQGARTTLESILAARQKTIQAYISREKMVRFVGAEFLEKFLQKLSNSGYALEAICTSDVGKEEQPLSLKSDTQDNRNVRYAAPAFGLPMTVFLFDDKTVLFSSPEENFALVIESSEYAEMQKQLFTMLWNSLERTTIRVGILHSLSGTMAISERPLVDAFLMAIDEINASGGILSRRIDPIVADGSSDPDTFAREAEKLIRKRDVCSVFGGWTSASRKTMKPIFEKYDHVLWYPLQYEGLEESPNIIYTGAAPNQQMLPAVDWAARHLGKNFFLVGSDYVFPRSAHEIMKARIEELGAAVVGEEYRKLGSSAFKPIIKKIQQTRPDVILNTINGDSNVAFFKELRAAGVTPKHVPTVSFSIAEEEISRMHPESMVGDYAAWSYFQSVSSKENASFVTHFQTKYGRHRVTDDPVETAYWTMHLFAVAVQKAGSDNTLAIRDAARGLSLLAPEGTVRIDSDNQHAHRIARIGQLQKDGQYKIVWSSETPIKPDPYPKYKSRKEWDLFLEHLFERWGAHWAKQ